MRKKSFKTRAFGGNGQAAGHRFFWERLTANIALDPLDKEWRSRSGNPSTKHFRFKK
jgi:hypothetical protein